MRTAKRELNPAITAQREAHNKVTASLKDRIKSLEEKNRILYQHNDRLIRAATKVQIQVEKIVVFAPTRQNRSDLNELNIQLLAAIKNLPE